MTPTDAMVEKVARASFATDPLSLVYDWRDILPEARTKRRLDARSAIAAYEAALNEAGLAVVPREPTREMLAAADPTMGDIAWRWEQMAAFYRRMLAAASPAPKDTKQE